MNIDENYQKFIDHYFEQAADLSAYFGIPSITALLMSPRAPMAKKDWLEKELEDAVENEDYEYCNQLKLEIEKIRTC